MTELFLGIIALAVLVMAVIQVAAVVLAARTARRVDRLADRLEQDLRPIVTNLQTVTAEAARASALATAQLERADRLFNDIGTRVEHILAAVQETLIAPAREGCGSRRGALAVRRQSARRAHPRALGVAQASLFLAG